LLNLAARRLLLAAAVALLALPSALLTGIGPRSVRPAHAACQALRLIPIGGLGTSSSDVPRAFADIVNAIGEQYDGIDYFSYNIDNPFEYSQPDSVQSDARSVEVLHQKIGREIAACDGMSIDLIGHSNGGVIALRYLATYGATAEGSHVRHVITLDSPVNGLSPDHLASFVQTAALYGVDLSYLLNSDAHEDSIASYNDPTTPQRNITLAQSLEGRIEILTMGSDDDLLVPYQSAAIPGFDSEWSLGVVSNLCPTYVDACVGHNQILHDPGVLAKIASFLGTASRFASPG
jgi:pimeloyl-ACP methyl ester carboxylesterase